MSDEIKPVEPTAAQTAAAKAKAARIKQVEEIRAKRTELEKNVGKTFTDGEKEAKIAAFEKNNIQTETGWLTDDFYIVNFGNPFVHKHIPCGEFLKTFKPKE